MKVCRKCLINKPESEFHKRGNGLNSWCKKCHSEYGKSYSKKYRHAHRNEILLKKHEYRSMRREDLARKQREYRAKHKRERMEYDKQYRASHKKEKNIREKVFRQTNINYRISCALRSRINKIVKKERRAGSAVRDLCCSAEELRTRIESMFRNGMTWDNYGSLWHIDHIKPLAAFDLTDREQFLEACNYKNLQPLLAHENLSKGTK